MIIKLDASNFIEADDGDTCHYGGSVTINGVEFRCYGNDRGDGECWTKMDNHLGGLTDNQRCYLVEAIMKNVVGDVDLGYDHEDEED